MKPVFECRQGAVPLLVSFPHSGLLLDRGMQGRMTAAATRLPDTDWHVPDLYNFLEDLDATILRAEYSRYVVDLNRPPDGAALYAGQSETALCPLTTFDNQPIYRADQAPDGEEIRSRIERFWLPYHGFLRATLEQMVKEHGYALLWDAHSIASRVPRFFQGRLPDLNLGSADGAACARPVADAVLAVMSRSQYSAVRNGRFKGGHITRAYGAPRRHIQALQMEIAQASYMDETSGKFCPEAADRLRPVLRKMLVKGLQAARDCRA